ncbi:MAG: hypothetical protein K6U07_03515 [Firmicutes bacterium]|nr:hypothetical protein [Bacillota bacterium]
MLKPGQRLVSREGDLWRWDGFAAAADAPSAAARRLAEKNRLFDLGRELEAARAEVEAKARTVAAAEAEVTAAAAAEAEVRARWREAQRAALAAREAHAAAEREVSRIAARVAALTEARARLAASREEAAAASREAAEALAGLASPTELESELARVRGEVGERRAALAHVRGEAQALAREAELTERRLAAIATDGRAWEERRAGALQQISTLENRRAETEAERSGLADAPAVFAEKRQALISSIEAAEAAVHAGYPEDAAALLIVELEGEEPEVEAELAELLEVVRASGAYEVRLARDEADRQRIWKGRKGAFSAVGRLSPDYLVQDGVVPRTQLGTALAEIEQLSRRYGLRVANVFHAGDGNLHPLILYDGRQPGQLQRAEELAGEILRLCIRLGGSITGEHGVGMEKRQYLAEMFSEPDLEVMRRLRRAMDPGEIANRGKMFPVPQKLEAAVAS